MKVKMTRYTNADFADDESINSVQFTEGISSSATHIRYHAGTSLWKQRTLLEKALLALVATLSFVVFVLAIIVHSEENRLYNAKIEHQSISPIEKTIQDEEDEYFKIPYGVVPNPNTCMNESCIHISSTILSSMDQSEDPCNDFYAYACNGWIKKNPIPDGKSTWGTFQKLEQQNQLIIKHVLEQPHNSFKSKAEQKAKMYYESCLDVNETVENLGAKPMLQLLKKLGGWNITDPTFNISNKWELQNIIQLVQNKYNIGAFFSYSVGEDDKNSSRHILQVDQSGLTLPTREDYLNKTEHAKVLEEYLNYMSKIGVLLGGEPNSTREQCQDLIEFETKLANITTPNELRRDEEAVYHLMTISELNQKAPFLDWTRFFVDAMRKVNKKISAKEQIVVYAPEYLGNLTQLIKEYQKTLKGKIILHNYVIWQTVRMFTGCLSKPFRDAYKGLRKALMGSEGGDEPQWRYCVQDTNSVLGFAVGAIFVREVFDQHSKLHAEQMIENIRNAFIYNLKHLDWIDKDTAQAAKLKADAISDMIGYPEFIRDSVQLDAKYENLTIKSDTYFDNNLRIMYYTLKKTLEKLDEPVNKTAWGMTPSTVNAYYTPNKNQMVFPAGILQTPFYDRNFPSSLNYGGMGVVMGHELTHGFDDQGREFDLHGNLKHWWKNETVDRFKNATKCFVDQYDKYEMNGKHLNGNQTLGENIADNGGLKAAFYAYMAQQRKRPEPPKLPGLEMNHKQLFFLSFAQVWCSESTKENTALQIEKDPHSPAKFRVIGALSNLKDFSEEFNCPLGSKMNPKDKCIVW